jgi:hypothetical protein
MYVNIHIENKGSGDDAIPVVAGQMVHWPLGPTPLCSKAQKIVDLEESDTEHYLHDLHSSLQCTPIHLDTSSGSGVALPMINALGTYSSAAGTSSPGPPPGYAVDARYGLP